jgi:hypothetical protein
MMNALIIDNCAIMARRTEKSLSAENATSTAYCLVGKRGAYI